MTLLGVVLAGGRSVRFGSDKALADLHGRSLLLHAVDILAPVCDEIVIGGFDRGVDGLRAVPDRPREDLGPLGGLCGALAYAGTHGHAAIVSVGCDTPRLDRSVIARLLAVRGIAYVAEAPIIGYWPTTLATGLSEHLEAGGDRSIRRWADAQGAAVIAAGVIVPNLNRPDDLEALRHLERYPTG